MNMKTTPVVNMHDVTVLSLEMYVFQIALKVYIFNILPLFQHGMSITLNRQSKCISVAGSRDELNKRGHKLIRNKSLGMK